MLYRTYILLTWRFSSTKLCPRPGQRVFQHPTITTLLATGFGIPTLFEGGFGRLPPYLRDCSEVRWWSLKWDPVHRQIWRRSSNRMHPWYCEGKAGMRWSVTPPVSWRIFPAKQPRTWAEG